MKEQDETKLPKWAQARLTTLRMEVDRRDGLQSLHAVLCEPEREWFTIPGPQFDSDERHRNLFVLSRNSADPICDLGPGDLLFVGRAKK